jgi:UDP-N-acetylmuramate dehydrogenase
MAEKLIAPPIPLIEDEPMARHTSWRVGGPARYYAEVLGVEQARALASWANEADLALIWVGGGTNLLVRDAGFSGLIARYRAQDWQIEEQGNTATLRAEVGAPMAGTARRMGTLGWAGLAWAEGVPGTVGGAVFGNAGCYGGDIAGLLQSVTMLVGDAVEEWPAARMAYGYRRSALKDASRAPGAPPLILAASLQLRRGDPVELADTMERIAAQRKSKTPVGSTCGSVFKNPPGHSAGQLIERAGFKGARVGAAEISQHHANYIVNRGGASSDDILGLIAKARDAVRSQFSIDLELEVRVI